jgi:hypothetical protein
LDPTIFRESEGSGQVSIAHVKRAAVSVADWLFATASGCGPQRNFGFDFQHPAHILNRQRGEGKDSDPAGRANLGKLRLIDANRWDLEVGVKRVRE